MTVDPYADLRRRLEAKLRRPPEPPIAEYVPAAPARRARELRIFQTGDRWAAEVVLGAWPRRRVCYAASPEEAGARLEASLRKDHIPLEGD